MSDQNIDNPFLDKLKQLNKGQTTPSVVVSASEGIDAFGSPQKKKTLLQRLLTFLHLKPLRLT